MNLLAVICVDDEQTILDSLKIELEEVLGDEYLLEMAQSGEEALEVLLELKEDNYEVAVVIADYIMPEMKGDEVLKRIHEISPTTLKIMLTGQADVEGVVNAINAAKLYRYLSKPWQAEDLKLTVKEALHSYLQSRNLAEKNAELETMNQQLQELIKEQSDLISKLHENENRLFQLNQAYERFVPSQFLDWLQKKSIVDVELGDCVEKEMSVLFSDIRDFTTLSETMSPEDNFKFINSYLYRMEPVIIEHNGFIDKYVGDGIMALFGGGADDALQAGIAMLHQLREYNKTRITPERVPIKIGVGINTGSLMLGTVGGRNRMDGTVISDAVNLAARIESLTKVYQVSLLISHHTFLQLENPDVYAIRSIGKIRVKGKSELVTVYEVFDADASEVKEGKLATLELFAEALSFYNLNSFGEAKGLFEECLRVNSGDRVARVYLQFCEKQTLASDGLLDLDSDRA